MVMDLTTKPSSNYYGYYSGSYQNPPQLAAKGGTLFFAEGDAAHGMELWSLSAAQAPALVDDINPGSGSSSPHDFVAFGTRSTSRRTTARLLSRAGSGQQPVRRRRPSPHSRRRTQPPAPGPRRSSQSAPTSSSSPMMVSTAARSGQPTALQSPDGAAGRRESNQIRSLHDALGKQEAYFVGSSPATGPGFWETDGTAGGTSLVKSLPGSGSGYYYYNHSLSLTLAGGKLFSRPAMAMAATIYGSVTARPAARPSSRISTVPQAVVARPTTTVSTSITSQPRPESCFSRRPTRRVVQTSGSATARLWAPPSCRISIRIPAAALTPHRSTA